MSTIYASSDNIKIFPAVRRGEYDPFSRLMSESTITSIINRLIDSSGFVITRSSDNTVSSGVFEFNINGYYVKVDSIEEITDEFSSSSDLYATITLYDPQSQEEESDMKFIQIEGADDDGEYTGVTFSDTQPNEDNTFFLKILTRGDNNAWVIPEESKIKFAKDTLEFYDIDGGVI